MLQVLPVNPQEQTPIKAAFLDPQQQQLLQRAKHSLERINAHLEFRKNAQFHHTILEKTILEVQQLEQKENAGQPVIKLMDVEGGVLFMFCRVSKKNQRSLFNLAERLRQNFPKYGIEKGQANLNGCVWWYWAVPDEPTSLNQKSVLVARGRIQKKKRSKNGQGNEEGDDDDDMEDGDDGDDTNEDSNPFNFQFVSYGHKGQSDHHSNATPRIETFATAPLPRGTNPIASPSQLPAPTKSMLQSVLSFANSLYQQPSTPQATTPFSENSSGRAVFIKQEPDTSMDTASRGKKRKMNDDEYVQTGNMYTQQQQQQPAWSPSPTSMYIQDTNENQFPPPPMQNGFVQSEMTFQSSIQQMQPQPQAQLQLQPQPQMPMQQQQQINPMLMQNANQQVRPQMIPQVQMQGQLQQQMQMHSPLQPQMQQQMQLQSQMQTQMQPQSQMPMQQLQMQQMQFAMSQNQFQPRMAPRQQLPQQLQPQPQAQSQQRQPFFTQNQPFARTAMGMGFTPRGISRSVFLKAVGYDNLFQINVGSFRQLHDEISKIFPIFSNFLILRDAPVPGQGTMFGEANKESVVEVVHNDDTFSDIQDGDVLRIVEQKETVPENRNVLKLKRVKPHSHILKVRADGTPKYKSYERFIDGTCLTTPHFLKVQNVDRPAVEWTVVPHFCDESNADFHTPAQMDIGTYKIYAVSSAGNSNWLIYHVVSDGDALLKQDGISVSTNSNNVNDIGGSNTSFGAEKSPEGGSDPQHQMFDVDALFVDGIMGALAIDPENLVVKCPNDKDVFDGTKLTVHDHENKGSNNGRKGENGDNSGEKRDNDKRNSRRSNDDSDDGDSDSDDSDAASKPRGLPLGRTPLHYAAALGSLKWTTTLVNAGYCPFKTDDHGRTSFWMAAQGGHAHIMEFFLRWISSQPEPTSTSTDTTASATSSPPTTTAHGVEGCQAEMSQTSMIRTKQAARLALIPDHFSITPLNIALLRGHHHVLPVFPTCALLGYLNIRMTTKMKLSSTPPPPAPPTHTNPFAQCTPSESTCKIIAQTENPLFIATASGSAKAVEFLGEMLCLLSTKLSSTHIAYAYLNERNAQNETLLHVAARFNHQEVLQILRSLHLQFDKAVPSPPLSSPSSPSSSSISSPSKWVSMLSEDQNGITPYSWTQFHCSSSLLSLPSPLLFAILRRLSPTDLQSFSRISIHSYLTERKFSTPVIQFPSVFFGEKKLDFSRPLMSKSRSTTNLQRTKEGYLLEKPKTLHKSYSASHLHPAVTAKGVDTISSTSSPASSPSSSQSPSSSSQSPSSTTPNHPTVTTTPETTPTTTSASVSASDSTPDAPKTKPSPDSVPISALPNHSRPIASHSAPPSRKARTTSAGILGGSTLFSHKSVLSPFLPLSLFPNTKAFNRLGVMTLFGLAFLLNVLITLGVLVALIAFFYSPVSDVSIFMTNPAINNKYTNTRFAPGSSTSLSEDITFMLTGASVAKQKRSVDESRKDGGGGAAAEKQKANPCGSDSECKRETDTDDNAVSQTDEPGISRLRTKTSSGAGAFTNYNPITNLCRQDVIAQLQNTVVAVVKSSSANADLSLFTWSAVLTDTLLNPVMDDEFYQRFDSTVSEQDATSVKDTQLCVDTLVKALQPLKKGISSAPIPIASLPETINTVAQDLSASGAEGLVVLHYFEREDAETMKELKSRLQLFPTTSVNCFPTFYCDKLWWTHSVSNPEAPAKEGLEAAHTVLVAGSSPSNPVGFPTSLLQTTLQEKLPQVASDGDKFWHSFSYLIDSAHSHPPANAIFNVLTESS